MVLFYTLLINSVGCVGYVGLYTALVQYIFESYLRLRYDVFYIGNFKPYTPYTPYTIQHMDTQNVFFDAVVWETLVFPRVGYKTNPTLYFKSRYGHKYSVFCI